MSIKAVSSLPSVTPSQPIGQFAFYGDFLQTSSSDGVADMWTEVNVELNNLPLIGALNRWAYVRWNVAFQKISADIPEAFFPGNPVSYKRGFWTPSYGIYALERNLLQYDFQRTQTYSFNWSDISAEPGIGALNPLTAVGIANRFYSPKVAYFNGNAIGDEYVRMGEEREIATLLRYQILQPFSYNVLVSYAGLCGVYGVSVPLPAITVLV